MSAAPTDIPGAVVAPVAEVPPPGQDQQGPSDPGGPADPGGPVDPGGPADPAPGATDGPGGTGGTGDPSPGPPATPGTPGGQPGPTPGGSPDEPGTATTAPPVTPAPTPRPTEVQEPAATEAPVPVPTTQSGPWSTEPTVVGHTFPVGTLLTAALVLVVVLAAAALTFAGVRRSRGLAAAGTGTPADPLVPAVRPDTEEAPPLSETVQLLMTLGAAMIDASVPVGEVTRTLERVATVHGAADAEVIALPTALLVSVPGRAEPQTAASSTGARALRLHQVQDVLRVAELAMQGTLRPAEATARVRAAVQAPPLYAGPVRVLAYMAVSAGLAMILGGGLVDVLTSAALGAAIGAVLVAGTRVVGAHQALLLLGCAFGVSVTVFLLSRTGADIGMLAPLVAPLVSFLPGALLTTAAIDLATRQMIAGSARLAAGGMQLVLLALGVTAAAALVGVPASEVGAAPYQPLGWAGPWLGVLVYGVGVVFHHCAQRSALPWVLLVLVVAYAGQVLGGLFFGGVFSGFVGALLMTLVAMYAASRPTGPPTLVGFLPGFWLLVPGALGLVGVTSALGEGGNGLSTVMTAAATMVAISLGVLAGLALGSTLSRRAAALTHA